MPLPLLIPIAIAVASSAGGLWKGAKALSDRSEAKGLTAEAGKVFNDAESKMLKARDTTKDSLASLGECRLRAWDMQLGRFVRLFEQFRDVVLEGGVSSDSRLIQITQKDLKEIRTVSLRAGEVVGGGIAAVGAGALAGFGAYGGATMLATASTGTAISTLSGAAATNATMAWFGGGSLASGGLGVAGGTMVLGGLVAGPALLVGGIVLSAIAKKKLAEARSSLAQAREAAAGMNKVTVTLIAVRKMAEQHRQFIEDVLPMADRCMNGLENIIHRHRQMPRSWPVRVITRLLYPSFPSLFRIKYASLSPDERRQMYFTVAFIDLLKQMLTMPLLSDGGEVLPDAVASMKKLRATKTQLLEHNPASE